MGLEMPKKISVLEFKCTAAVRFFERCAACPRFGSDCPDLERGKKILRGQKKIAYTAEATDDTIHANAFNCLEPLRYIERSRLGCSRGGRCRGEGLLLALLDGKTILDYSYKKVIKVPLKQQPREATRKAA